jgi:Flp pilus assembly CpaF family ATPase
MVIKRLVIERQRAVDQGQPALESRAPRRETVHACAWLPPRARRPRSVRDFRHAGAAAKVSAYDPRYDPPA